MNASPLSPERRRRAASVVFSVLMVSAMFAGAIALGSAPAAAQTTDWTVDTGSAVATDVKPHPTEDRVFVSTRTSSSDTPGGKIMMLDHDGNVLEEVTVDYNALTITFNEETGDVVVAGGQTADGGEGVLESYSKTNLDRNWRQDSHTGTAVMITTGPNGDVFVPTHNKGNNDLLRMDGGDGTIVEKFGDGSRDYTGIAYEPDLDMMFTAAETEGVVAAHDRSTLSREYNVSTAATPRSTAYYNGSIYAGSTTGDLILLNVGSTSGSVEWERSLSGVSGRMDELSGSDRENQLYGVDSDNNIAFGSDASANVLWDDTVADTPFNIGASSYDGDPQVFVPLGNGDLTKLTGDALTSSRTVSGQVVSCEVTDPACNDPQPVGGAQVVVYGVDHQSVQDYFDDVSSASEAEEKAEELLDEAENLEPPEWKPDLSLLGTNGKFSTASENYVAVHARSEWGLAGYTDTPELDSPHVKVPANQPVVLSVWDPSDDGFVQDGVDDQLPGATTEGTIVIEQLGPGGDEVVDTTTLEADADKNAYRTGSPIGPSALGKDHAIVETELSPGYYRVSAEGSAVSYVIQVGDRPFAGVVKDMRDEADHLLDQAQRIEEYMDAGVMERHVVTTNPDGRYRVYIENDAVETVGVYGYKAGSELDPTSNRSMLKQIQDARAAGYNGSVNVPRDPVHVAPPEKDVQVRTTRVPSDPFGELDGLSDFQLEQLADFLDTSVDEMMGVWSPSDSDYLNDDGSVGDGIGNTPGDATSPLATHYERLVSIAENSGIEVDTTLPPASELSNAELLDRIRILEDAIQSQADAPNAPDDGGDVEDGVYNARFGFGGDVDPESVSAMVEWGNGQLSVVGDEYISVEESALGSGDAVVIEDYPVPSDRAVADVRIDASVDGETKRGRDAIQNPAYDGDVPYIEAVDVSKIHPGPSDSVEVELRPEEDTGYKTMTDLEVYGPEGEFVEARMEGGEKAIFQTDGPGTYFARATYEAQDGKQFEQTFQLKASEASGDTPPTVRADRGPHGPFAIAGDGLRSARLDVDEEQSVTRVDAVLPAEGNAPPEVHVQVGEEMRGDKMKFQVLRGSDEQNIRKHIDVVVHEQIGDDTLLWHQLGPITHSGETRYGEVQHRDGSDKDLIMTWTDERGALDLDIIRDPGWFDNAKHRFNVWTDGIPVIGTIAVDVASLPSIPIPSMFNGGIGA